MNSAELKGAWRAIVRKLRTRKAQPSPWTRTA